MISPRAFLVCAVVLLGASSHAALAQCPGPCGPPGSPCPATSTFPNLIVGGGSELNGLTAVPFAVHVRDAASLSLAGVPVELRFPVGAGTHGNQLQAVGQFVDCATGRLIRPTNADGVALFYPQFYGCENAPVVQVVAGGVCLGQVRARSTDSRMTPSATVDLADWTGFANAYLFKVPYQACFDYNDNGIVDLPDLTIFARDFGAAVPGAYCTTGW